MVDETDTDWIDALKQKQSELEKYLSFLRASSAVLPVFEHSKAKRPAGEFRYLELPVKLDNLMRNVSGAITTTEITNRLVAERNVDHRTWVKVNQNVSRLLNNRVKQGVIRKLGRIQGANRSILWEYIG